MTKRLVLLATILALPLLWVGAASASAPPPPAILSTTSGPPGTVVTITQITICDNHPGITTGTIGLATLGQEPIGPTTTFTPPTATFTIPEVPNGDYYLYETCGDGVEGQAFTVTGSTVVPPPTPVNAAPVFTG